MHVYWRYEDQVCETHMRLKYDQDEHGHGVLISAVPNIQVST